MRSYKRGLVSLCRKSGAATKTTSSSPKKISLYWINFPLVVRLKSTRSFCSENSCGNFVAYLTSVTPPRSSVQSPKTTKNAKKNCKRWPNKRGDSRAFRWGSLSTDMTMKCLVNSWRLSWTPWKSANSGNIKWLQTKWRNALRFYLSSRADMTSGMKSISKSFGDDSSERVQSSAGSTFASIGDTFSSSGPELISVASLSAKKSS